MKKPVQQQPQRKQGKPVKLGRGLGPVGGGLKPKKPQGQKDEQGRYGFSTGGVADFVAKAMDVLKPN
jgi:hypothetical protein